MPPATNIGNNNLRIDLAAPPGWTYAAGDTIIGQIVRPSPIVSPDASVEINLIGRLKTKFALAHSQTGQQHRSRWDLWASKSHLLFSGPLHSPTAKSTSDPLAWSFSVMIPTCPEPSAADGHSNQESFIPLKPESIINQPLPGSYSSTYNDANACHQVFVEYHLEAQLSYISGGSRKVHQAVHPIIMKHPVSQLLTGENELQRHTIKLDIRDRQFEKKTKDHKLTMRQKIHKCLAAPETREFVLEVCTPRLIELDDPCPFPFIIRISPRLDNPGLPVKETVQKVQINWVKLSLYSRVQFCASTRNRPHVGDHFFAHHLQLEKVFRNLGSPIALSSDGGDEVDIGRLLELRLTSGGLLSLGKLIHAVPEIHPDFATYNIKHSNSLEWKLSITMGRETRVIQEECSQLTISAPRG